MHKKSIGLCMALIIGGLTRGQELSIIPPHSIEITLNKTTSLVFPFPITHVDRGSRDVLAQVVKKADTVILLKAARENFEETNLSVITADGKLYLFIVSYAAHGTVLGLRMKDTSTGKAPESSVKAGFYSRPDAATVKTEALEAASAEHFLSKHINTDEAKLSLKALYLKKGLLWFIFSLRNKSFIPYFPYYVRFFLKDKSRIKRTALQETELLQVYRNMETIVGRATGKGVFALEQFTIPQRKELIVQIGEKNSGRELVLRISRRLLLKTRLLP